MDNITKYNLELFKEILDKCDEKEEDLKENVCLITNDNLEDNFITLKCNHKFNYLSLYNEVVYQKTKKILDNSKLKLNEIKCPYCRSITDCLIPFYKYYDVKNIKGVTYPEHYTMKLHQCEHVKNNIRCCKFGCKTKDGIFCNNHIKIKKQDEVILDNASNHELNFYKKMNLKQLKNILKLNKCKVSGNKEDLINRIIIAKQSITFIQNI